MNDTLTQQPSPWRYLWLIALIGLPALGWHGILDDFSSKDIDASITNAGLIYGTARGINALVSMLQGTELNIPFLTFSIGEILDPINDLIERFSDIVLLALGSLALQKILLAIVSASMFNTLLTTAAVVTGVSIFLGNSKLLSGMLRVFLVIAFFRFSLGLVVLANSWVDDYFLDAADQKRHDAMQSFQGELRTLDELSRKADEAIPNLAKAQKELSQLKLDQSDLKASLESLTITIKDLELQLDIDIEKEGILCKISVETGLPAPTCSESVKNLMRQLDEYRSERQEIQSRLDTIGDAIEEKDEEIICLDKRIRGEKCSPLELPDFLNVEELRQKFNSIAESISLFAENCINLLVSLLLKTIAIPLLFIFLLLKIMRMNWGRI